jgi:hypothetical protein
MKNKLFTILGTTILGVTLYFGPCLAEDPFAAFTFGESGQALFFEMTNRDIASQNKALLKPATIKSPTYEQTAKRVKAYELPESGVTFEFAMSKEEIELERVNAAKKPKETVAASEKKNAARFEKFELAESGYELLFSF